MRWVLGIALSALMAGAAFAGQKSESFAGHAEGYYAASPELVTAVLIEEMRERQYFLVEETSGNLRFARPIDNAALRAELGSLNDPLPQARVIFTIAPEGGQTRVASDFLIVTHPGDAREQLADASKLGIDPGLKTLLDDLPQTVAGYLNRQGDRQLALAESDRD